MKTPPFALINSFLAFVEAENMQEAAKLIGLSQPALTSHLKQFQGYFPQDVFAMEGRKKTLTPFGEELKSLLKARFDNLNLDIMELNQKFGKPDDIRLIIAGRAEILGSIADKLVFPGTLVFLHTDSVGAVEGLLNRQFHIALTTHISRAAQLHAKKFFSDSFCVIAPKKWGHEGGSVSKSVLAALIEKPYLSYKEEDGNLNKVLESYKVDAEPKLKKIISDWRRLSDMVSDEQGWTICPDTFIDREKHDVFRIPVNIIPQTDYYYIYRKEFMNFDWFKTFLNQFRNVKR